MRKDAVNFKGRRKNKCRFLAVSRPRMEGVVAQRLSVVTLERDGSEAGIGDLDAARVLLVDEQCTHLQLQPV